MHHQKLFTLKPHQRGGKNNRWELQEAIAQNFFAQLHRYYVRALEKYANTTLDLEDALLIGIYPIEISITSTQSSFYVASRWILLFPEVVPEVHCKEIYLTVFAKLAM